MDLFEDNQTAIGTGTVIVLVIVLILICSSSSACMYFWPNIMNTASNVRTYFGNLICGTPAVVTAPVTPTTTTTTK